MNTDIRLTITFWDNPKTIKFERKCGLEGVRSLQILWCFAAAEYPKGDLVGLDDDDIEIAAKWRGEPGEFVKALVAYGWLDGESGNYSLHNWEKRQGYVSKAPERSEKAKKAINARWSNTKTNKQDNSCNTQKNDNANLSNTKNENEYYSNNDEVILNNAISNTPSPLPLPSPSPDHIKPPVLSNESTSPLAKVDEPAQEEKRLEEKPPEKRKTFKPPTLQEISGYCKERQNSVNPERFFDYYASNGWKVGRNAMKDWKAAVRTWESSEQNFNNSRASPYPRADKEDWKKTNPHFNKGNGADYANSVRKCTFGDDEDEGDEDNE